MLVPNDIILHRFHVETPQAGFKDQPSYFFHAPYNPTPPPGVILNEARTRKHIHWFDMPAEWHHREFIVFFGDAEMDSAELPPQDSTVKSNQIAIGPLSLEDGRRVWLRSLSKPIPEESKKYVLDVRRTIAGIKVDKVVDDLRQIGVVMHLSGSSVVCVPFGLETINTL